MREPLKVLDLFSGIGGFSLGLERAGGFKTVAFCEIEEFPRRVLAKHWPGVPIHRDVRGLRAEHVGAVEVICGGFPCQDISTAGKGAGLAGERSGLWREYARLIGEIRPGFVIVENVAALLGRGLGTVLGDLAALGYDAEWQCISAAECGAPHRRDRLWIVAYPAGDGWGEGRKECFRSNGSARGFRSSQFGRGRPRGRAPILAHTSVIRLPGSGQSVDASHSAAVGARKATEPFNGGASDQWLTEPDVGRVAHGVPSRVDRLRGLGNAVVPQIPEIIGRAILASITDGANSATGKGQDARDE